MAERSIERYCLVTVGATVGFEQLTKAVLQPALWKFLSSEGFTALHVQSGPDVGWAAEKLSSQKSGVPPGFDVDVFESRENLLLEEMTLCKAVTDKRDRGLIIAHAGELQSVVTQFSSYVHRYWHHP